MSKIALPAFVVLAVVFGGSEQGVIGLLILGLCGALALTLGLTQAHPDDADRRIETLAFLFVALVAIQLVPLPAALWTHLPGRSLIREGDASLGIADAWRTLSVAPRLTLSSLAFLVAPLGMIVAVQRVRTLNRRWLAWSVVGAAFFSALFAAAQVGAVVDHPYAVSSDGPTGFFANTNHLATLMLLAIPFVGALVTRRSRKMASLRPLLLLGLLIFLSITLLTGSIAMIALALPITIASLVLGNGWTLPLRLRRAVAVLAVAAGIGLAVLLGVGGISSPGVSLDTRLSIWRIALGEAHWAVAGSGLGTFRPVFQLAEDMFRTDRFYVNHAHNDLLQFAIEAGIPGLLLLLAFLVWWASRAFQILRTGRSGDPYARAAMLGSFVVLVHSLVDFPLRTGAVSVVFALCLALMARPKTISPPRGDKDLRETRHRKVA